MHPHGRSMHTPTPDPREDDEEPAVKDPPVPPDQEDDVVPQRDPPDPGERPMIASRARSYGLPVTGHESLLDRQHPAFTPSTAMTFSRISRSSSPAKPISASTPAISDPGLAAGRPAVTGVPDSRTPGAVVVIGPKPS
jgi:hypothetical protein